MVNRIREYRLAKNWTQEEVAAKLNVSKWYLNRLENEKVIASLQMRVRIATLFDAQITDIFLSNDGQNDQ
ncbi:helix-turn-helix transcriptional regulator [Fictibacillus aquaticus]|uniref:HTH cro/C1-type domain-containing protein n=1 Tax=Fictibacillus aquaticus TaxID=2021314 RepID=A0A235FBN9_9BACL|nr:helix-turn-helix transcriptional regulator [Fictibacillus aquaticus]OYD58434.1 hypothetical protein CGZ90_00590 [Fictibacillus aquaticus]